MYGKYILNYPETVIRKSGGYNESEKHMIQLCENTFLSLWSYPNLFRNQGKNVNNKTSGKGDGKELCDLLVVYENHIIIFSDKKCEYPTGNDTNLNWSRWYRRAIFDSAKQIFGAERWIFKHPNEIYIDKSCTISFPFELPSIEHAHVHRIVIANGISEHCKKNIGGSGSLRLNPSLIGNKDYDYKESIPFTIGQVDPDRGFIHVFDDITLDIIMSKLDTITDFINYLQKKEELILAGKLLEADGEEDLLAHYLMRTDSTGMHSFFSYDNEEPAQLRIEAGLWNRFLYHPSHLAQCEANEISYSWDRLIEKFFFHIMNGTAYEMSHPTLKEQERLFRWLARENRTRRRLLGKSINDFIQSVPPRRRGTRVVQPSTKGDPLYLFLILPQLGFADDAEYRKTRQQMLMDYLVISKYDFQNIDNLIGIATEGYESCNRSEDISYLDASSWDENDNLNARELKQEYIDKKWLSQRNMIVGQVNEYPTPRSDNAFKRIKGNKRNDKCFCGSGKKLKKCCMKI